LAKFRPHRSNARRFCLGKVHFDGVGWPAVAPAVRFLVFWPFGVVGPLSFFVSGVFRFAGLPGWGWFRQSGGFWLVRLARKVSFLSSFFALGLFPGFWAAGCSVRLARLACQVICQVFHRFAGFRARSGAFSSQVVSPARSLSGFVLSKIGCTGPQASKPAFGLGLVVLQP